MSAMAKMFADMLLKELPDEVREALTPENIAKVTQAVSETFRYMKESQAKQLELLEAIHQKVCIDDNGSNGNRSSQRTPRKLAAITSHSEPGTDD